MNYKKIKKLLAIAIILFTSSSVFADTTAKFMSISDIHFNPFASCTQKPCPLIKKLQGSDYQNWNQIFEQDGEKKLATITQDTNYPLFKSALTEFKVVNQNQKPTFVLVLGDFLSHSFRKEYAKYS